VRVLHLAKAIGVAGSERHLLSLLPELRARGVDASMCVIVGPGGERFVQALRAVDVPTLELPAGAHVNVRLAPRIFALLRERRPDVVHTHLIHADVYGQPAGRAAGVPGVSTIHGTAPWIRRQPYRTAGVLAGRCARRTIAISEHAARFAIDLGLAAADRVRVVLYGIDADQWVDDGRHRADSRASFGIAADELVVGVASRLVPHKGHDFLLAGFEAARREQPGLRLLVAGEGPLRAELEALAAPAGDRVEFLGYLGEERLVSFMQACDVIAFPTLPTFGEGFGLAALEASAAGRPVVATDVASLPEVIDDGVTGVLVPPGNVPALGAALARLAGEPELRARMGVAGSVRARTRFDLGRMVDETIGVYEETLGTG
jgi:glycosyltransferase involved in cell wall biosynthesis